MLLCVYMCMGHVIVMVRKWQWNHLDTPCCGRGFIWSWDAAELGGGNFIVKVILGTELKEFDRLNSSWVLFLKSQTLQGITTNKASGGDGIPVELFQILKNDAVKVLHSICQQIWKIQQWPQDWKSSVLIPILTKGNAKECSNYCTIVLISHASKVMLKILQARLQQYVNRELPDVQADFRKGRGTRDQIANICWIIEKAREFQKNIYFFF